MFTKENYEKETEERKEIEKMLDQLSEKSRKYFEKKIKIFGYEMLILGVSFGLLLAIIMIKAFKFFII